MKSYLNPVIEVSQDEFKLRCFTLEHFVEVDVDTRVDVDVDNMVFHVIVREMVQWHKKMVKGMKHIKNYCRVVTVVRNEELTKLIIDESKVEWTS